MEFKLEVNAFDQPDAETQFVKRMKLVVDTLTVHSNLSFRAETKSTTDERRHGLFQVINPLFRLQAGAQHLKNIVLKYSTRLGRPLSIPIPQQTDNSFHLNTANLQFITSDWYDGFPIQAGKLAISHSCKALIEQISTGSLDDNGKILLDAFHHFQAAIALDPQFSGINLSEVGASREELCAVLYISALEVASTIDAAQPRQCKSCGQQVYSISKRVHELVCRLEGNCIADQIKELYGIRSRFLHVGVLTSTRAYAGTSLPQLSRGNPTGCSHQVSPIPLLNLREWTSHTLRELTDEVITGEKKLPPKPPEGVPIS